MDSAKAYLPRSLDPSTTDALRPQQPNSGACVSLPDLVSPSTAAIASSQKLPHNPILQNSHYAYASVKPSTELPSKSATYGSSMPVSMEMSHPSQYGRPPDSLSYPEHLNRQQLSHLGSYGALSYFQEQSLKIPQQYPSFPGSVDPYNLSQMYKLGIQEQHSYLNSANARKNVFVYPQKQSSLVSVDSNSSTPHAHKLSSPAAVSKSPLPSRKTDPQFVDKPHASLSTNYGSTASKESLPYKHKVEFPVHYAGIAKEPGRLADIQLYSDSFVEVSPEGSHSYVQKDGKTPGFDCQSNFRCNSVINDSFTCVRKIENPYYVSLWNEGALKEKSYEHTPKRAVTNVNGIHEGMPLYSGNVSSRDIKSKCNIASLPLPSSQHKSKDDLVLDLSVKTVRQTADSTAPDHDHISPKDGVNLMKETTTAVSSTSLCGTSTSDIKAATYSSPCNIKSSEYSAIQSFPSTPTTNVKQAHNDYCVEQNLYHSERHTNADNYKYSNANNNGCKSLSFRPSENLINYLKSEKGNSTDNICSLTEDNKPVLSSDRPHSMPLSSVSNSVDYNLGNYAINSSEDKFGRFSVGGNIRDSKSCSPATDNYNYKAHSYQQSLSDLKALSLQKLPVHLSSENNDSSIHREEIHATSPSYIKYEFIRPNNPVDKSTYESGYIVNEPGVPPQESRTPILDFRHDVRDPKQYEQHLQSQGPVDRKISAPYTYWSPIELAGRASNSTNISVKKEELINKLPINEKQSNVAATLECSNKDLKQCYDDPKRNSAVSRFRPQSPKYPPAAHSGALNEYKPAPPAHIGYLSHIQDLRANYNDRKFNEQNINPYSSNTNVNSSSLSGSNYPNYHSYNTQTPSAPEVSQTKIPKRPGISHFAQSPYHPRSPVPISKSSYSPHFTPHYPASSNLPSHHHQNSYPPLTYSSAYYSSGSSYQTVVAPSGKIKESYSDYAMSAYPNTQRASENDKRDNISASMYNGQTVPSPYSSQYSPRGMPSQSSAHSVGYPVSQPHSSYHQTEPYNSYSSYSRSSYVPASVSHSVPNHSFSGHLPQTQPVVPVTYHHPSQSSRPNQSVTKGSELMSRPSVSYSNSYAISLPSSHNAVPPNNYTSQKPEYTQLQTYNRGSAYPYYPGGMYPSSLSSTQPAVDSRASQNMTAKPLDTRKQQPYMQQLCQSKYNVKNNQTPANVGSFLPSKPADYMIQEDDLSRIRTKGEQKVFDSRKIERKTPFENLTAAIPQPLRTPAPIHMTYNNAYGMPGDKYGEFDSTMTPIEIKREDTQKAILSSHLKSAEPGKAALAEKLQKKLYRTESSDSLKEKLSNESSSPALKDLSKQDEWEKFDRLIKDLEMNPEGVLSKKSHTLSRRYQQRVQYQNAVDNNLIKPISENEEEESDSEPEPPVKFRGKFKSIKDKAVERVILTYASHSDESATEMIPDEDASDYEDELEEEIRSRKKKMTPLCGKTVSKVKEAEEVPKKLKKQDSDYSASFDSSESSASLTSLDSDEDSNSAESVFEEKNKKKYYSSSDDSSELQVKKKKKRKKWSSDSSSDEIVAKRVTRKKWKKDGVHESSEDEYIPEKNIKKSGLDTVKKMGTSRSGHKKNRKKSRKVKRKKGIAEKIVESDDESDVQRETRGMKKARKHELSSSPSLDLEEEIIKTSKKNKGKIKKIIDESSESETDIRSLSQKKGVDTLINKLKEIRETEKSREDVVQMKMWKSEVSCEMKVLLKDVKGALVKQAWKKPNFKENFPKGWQEEVKTFKEEIAKLPKQLISASVTESSDLEEDSASQKSDKTSVGSVSKLSSSPAKNTRSRTADTTTPISELDKSEKSQPSGMSSIMQKFFERVLGENEFPGTKKFSASPFSPYGSPRVPTGLTPTPSVAPSMMASDNSDTGSLVSIRTDLPASDSIPVARKKSIANTLIKKLRKKYNKKLNMHWLNKRRIINGSAGNSRLLPTPNFSFPEKNVSTFFRKETVRNYKEIFNELFSDDESKNVLSMLAEQCTKGRVNLTIDDLKAVFGDSPLLKKSFFLESVKLRHKLKNLDADKKHMDSAAATAVVEISRSCTPLTSIPMIDDEDDEDSELKSEKCGSVFREKILVPGLKKGKRKFRKKFSSGFDYIRKKKRTRVEEDKKTTVRRKRTDVVVFCAESPDYDINVQNNAGYMPLNEACNKGHLDIVQVLCAHGAQVNVPVHRGGVWPLHEAIENGHMQVSRLLLEYGADPSLKTYMGQSCTDLATDPVCKEWIEGYMADLTGKSAGPWKFPGPSLIFDPADEINNLFKSFPALSGESLQDCEITFEVSDNPLPHLYQVIGHDGKQYMRLEEVLGYLELKDERALIVAAETVEILELTQEEFCKKARCCDYFVPYNVGLDNGENEGDSGSTILGRKLVLYSAAIKELLSVEFVSVR